MNRLAIEQATKLAEAQRGHDLNHHGLFVFNGRMILVYERFDIAHPFEQERGFDFGLALSFKRISA